MTFLHKTFPSPITKSVCIRATRLTSRNQHNDARLHIAKALCHARAVKVFEALNQLQTAIGDMPEGLLTLRNEWTDKLYEYAELNYGERTRQQIYDCF